MFQYMIDYIYIHEGIDFDVEDLVDEMKTFTVEIDVINYQNFEGIAFPPSNRIRNYQSIRTSTMRPIKKVLRGDENAS